MLVTIARAIAIFVASSASALAGSPDPIECDSARVALRNLERRINNTSERSRLFAEAGADLARARADLLSDSWWARSDGPQLVEACSLVMGRGLSLLGLAYPPAERLSAAFDWSNKTSVDFLVHGELRPLVELGVMAIGDRALRDASDKFVAAWDSAKLMYGASQAAGLGRDTADRDSLRAVVRNALRDFDRAIADAVAAQLLAGAYVTASEREHRQLQVLLRECR